MFRLSVVQVGGRRQKCDCLVIDDLGIWDVLNRALHGLRRVHSEIAGVERLHM